MTAILLDVRSSAPGPGLAREDAVVLPVRFLGLGAHLPARRVTNDDLALRLDTSDEWVRTRTGIVARHIAPPETSTSDLALAALRSALSDAALDAGDLAAVIVATTTPDQSIPATAPIVTAALGVTVPAFDVNAACSGFVYGLRVAAGLAATGLGPVAVVGAETVSRAADPDDRATAVLFGDGAGAVIIGGDGGGGSLGPFDLGADGTLRGILETPAGEPYLRMKGREVYRHAVAGMTASSRRVLHASGLRIDEVDLVIGHQANRRILDAVAARLGVTTDQMHVTVDQHANTSAASIPLALADARDSGRLHDGDRVLLTAFGAGLTWGSCLLTWAGGAA